MCPFQGTVNIRLHALQLYVASYMTGRIAIVFWSAAQTVEIGNLDGNSHLRVQRGLSHAAPVDVNSRHVRAIPWPSGRWRTWRRIDAGHAGQLHSHKRARGHEQPRYRGGGNVGRGKGCRRRHRSGGGSPASCDTHGRGRPFAAQRTCAGRARWPARRTGGRVGPTATRRGASNRAARWRQKPPTSRRNRSRRADTITRGSSRARRTPKSLRAVAARNSRRWWGQGGRCRPGPVTLVAGQSFSAT